MVLARGIGSNLAPVWIPCFGYLMVLSHGVNEGLTINREEYHLDNASLQIEYLKI